MVKRFRPEFEGNCCTEVCIDVVYTYEKTVSAFGIRCSAGGRQLVAGDHSSEELSRDPPVNPPFSQRRIKGRRDILQKAMHTEGKSLTSDPPGLRHRRRGSPFSMSSSN